MSQQDVTAGCHRRMPRQDVTARSHGVRDVAKKYMHNEITLEGKVIESVIKSGREKWQIFKHFKTKPFRTR